jgi:hypothetical protein
MTQINTQADSAKHEAAIEVLAKESEVPMEQIAEMYRMECAQLELVARIKTYVPVIASRRVRVQLRTAAKV